MGLYINPQNGQSKEAFLKERAEPINPQAFKTFDFTAEPSKLPIVLVDNGPFTAAGVAYNERERKEWLWVFDKHERPMSFYLIAKDDLRDTAASGIGKRELDLYLREENL